MVIFKLLPGRINPLAGLEPVLYSSFLGWDFGEGLANLTRFYYSYYKLGWGASFFWGYQVCGYLFGDFHWIWDELPQGRAIRRKVILRGELTHLRPLMGLTWGLRELLILF